MCITAAYIVRCEGWKWSHFSSNLFYYSMLWYIGSYQWKLPQIRHSSQEIYVKVYRSFFRVISCQMPDMYIWLETEEGERWKFYWGITVLGEASQATPWGREPLEKGSSGKHGDNKTQLKTVFNFAWGFHLGRDKDCGGLQKADMWGSEVIISREDDSVRWCAPWHYLRCLQRSNTPEGGMLWEAGPDNHWSPFQS